mgnify:CR=1 FL=1
MIESNTACALLGSFFAVNVLSKVSHCPKKRTMFGLGSAVAASAQRKSPLRTAQCADEQKEELGEQGDANNDHVRTYVAALVEQAVAAQCAQMHRDLSASIEAKIEIALAGSDEQSETANQESVTVKEAENPYLVAFDAHQGAADEPVPAAPLAGTSADDKRERNEQYRVLIARVASDFRRTFFQDWSANLRAQRPFMNSVQRNFLQNMIAERFRYMEGAWRTHIDALVRENDALRQKIDALEHKFLQHSVAVNEGDQCHECDVQRNKQRHHQQQQQAGAQADFDAVFRRVPSPLSSPPPDEWPVALQHDAFRRSPTPP